jgi:hypothetical protein
LNVGRIGEALETAINGKFEGKYKEEVVAVTVLDIIHRPVFYLKLSSTL